MYNIIIVDDEQDILNVLEKFLSRTPDFNIKTFNNPSNALSHIKSNHCDLILMDIMMPNIDGIECLKRLHNEKPELKVIMMTAHDTLERSIEAHKYGAKNYVKKPFSSLPAVLEKVNRVLGK